MKLPVELDEREFRNLLAWAAHPLHAVQLGLFAVAVVWRSLLFRLCPAACWYPWRVRRATQQLGRPALADCDVPPPRSPPTDPGTLRLAVGHLKFDRVPDWHATFDDGEQFVSLHRWNWLLRALTDGETPKSCHWGVTMMRSWLAAMTPLPSGLASESYSVGERIANALIFARLAAGDWRGLPPDVRAALGVMAHDLARRLEYHGREATGNHPLNNARALYLAGQCLEQPALRRVALLVLAERLPVVQTADGFLREGSSHYHLLFTRWLLELDIAGREFEDHELLALLSRPLGLALARCWTLLVPDAKGGLQLPAIGDVSPDCEPAWLCDLVLSAPAMAHCRPAWPIVARALSGWACLWPAPTAIESISEVPAGDDGLTSFPQSGWHRLQWRGWTALWRTEPGGAPLEASHAHQDLCALVLYHHGREVLIDIGRPDYERGSIAGMQAVGHGAHNALSVDGLGPMPTRRDRFLPAGYRRGAVRVDSAVHGDRFRLTLAHDGFERLAGGGVQHQRRFDFAPDGILIEDVLQGAGTREVAVQFQWAARPHVVADGPRTAAAGGISIRTSGFDGSRSEFIEAGADGLAGWRYPAYGVRQPCVTQVMRGALALPATIRHEISLQMDAK